MTQASLMLAALRNGPVTALALNRAGVGRPNSRAAEIRHKVRADGLTVTCERRPNTKGAAAYLYTLRPLDEAAERTPVVTPPSSLGADGAAACEAASSSGPRVADQGERALPLMHRVKEDEGRQALPPLPVRPARSKSRGDTTGGTITGEPCEAAVTVAHASLSGRCAIPPGQLTLGQIA